MRAGKYSKRLSHLCTKLVADYSCDAAIGKLKDALFVLVMDIEHFSGKEGLELTQMRKEKIKSDIAIATVGEVYLHILMMPQNFTL